MREQIFRRGRAKLFASGSGWRALFNLHGRPPAIEMESPKNARPDANLRAQLGETARGGNALT